MAIAQLSQKDDALKMNSKLNCLCLKLYTVYFLLVTLLQTGNRFDFLFKPVTKFQKTIGMTLKWIHCGKYNDYIKDVFINRLSILQLLFFIYNYIVFLACLQ